MPNRKNFVVKQTREVRVVANTFADAAKLAGIAFEHGQNFDNAISVNNENSLELHGVWGNTISKIQEVGVYVDLEQ